MREINVFDGNYKSGDGDIYKFDLFKFHTRYVLVQSIFVWLHKQWYEPTMLSGEKGDSTLEQAVEHCPWDSARWALTIRGRSMDNVEKATLYYRIGDGIIEFPGNAPRTGMLEKLDNLLKKMADAKQPSHP